MAGAVAVHRSLLLDRGCAVGYSIAAFSLAGSASRETYAGIASEGRRCKA